MTKKERSKSIIVANMDLLELFREECLRHPDEPTEDLWELAKGWYEMRDFKNDTLTEKLKL